MQAAGRQRPGFRPPRGVKLFVRIEARLDAIRREARASARDPDSADAKARTKKPVVRVSRSLVGNRSGGGGDGARASKRARQREGRPWMKWRKKEKYEENWIAIGPRAPRGHASLLSAHVASAPHTMPAFLSRDDRESMMSSAYKERNIPLPPLASAAIGRKSEEKRNFRLYSRLALNTKDYLCITFNIYFNLYNI